MVRFGYFPFSICLTQLRQTVGDHLGPNRWKKGPADAAMENEKKARKELEAFLASERVCARTDDDKTLLLAARNRGD